HTVQMAACATQDLVRRFIVDDATSGAHPLHLARPHRADVAEAVLVNRPAFEQQAQRFDTGVRMRRGALGFARSHLDRTKMIKEDKGPDGFKDRRRDGATNLETVSFDGMEGGMKCRDFALAGEYEGIHARSRLNPAERYPPSTFQEIQII